ncbi:MAG TPA: LapA family protein [Mycobacteriales bacterium]|jgi:putative membrane protein|nr:LapA family protein [Mycobacteriales bacterium]
MADDVAATPKPNPIAGFLRSRWIPIVLAVVAAVFIGQNRNRVSIDLLWLQLSAPLWLILLVAVLVGIIIAASGSRRRRRQSR